LGDLRASEPLNKILSNTEEVSLREYAARALGKLGNAHDLKTLITCMLDKNQDMNVRKSAATALGKAHEASAVGPLMSLFSTNWDFHVSPAAGEALSELSKSAAEPLIGYLSDKNISVQEEAARALGKSADSRAVEPLIACLKGTRSELGTTAAKSLGELHDVRAVEPLIGCLSSKLLQNSAADALGELGDTRAVEPLLDCLTKESFDEKDSVAIALGRLGDKRAVEPLIASITNRQWNGGRLVSLEAAVASLGMLRDQRSLKVLLEMLPNWEIRKTLGKSLNEIGWEPKTGSDQIYLWICGCAAQLVGDGSLDFR
jgi:HEAT repeat protein